MSLLNNDVICAPDMAQVVAPSSTILRSQNIFLALDICELEIVLIYCSWLLTAPVIGFALLLAAVVVILADATK